MCPCGCSDLNVEELLYIDGLVATCGPLIGQMWTEEGGTPAYPPPNLHVRIYCHYAFIYPPSSALMMAILDFLFVQKILGFTSVTLILCLHLILTNPLRLCNLNTCVIVVSYTVYPRLLCDVFFIIDRYKKHNSYYT